MRGTAAAAAPSSEPTRHTALVYPPLCRLAAPNKSSRPNPNNHAAAGIGKRGDVYLRTLLIHGARTVLQHAASKTDRLSRWVMAVQARLGMNVAAVALANKLARIAWAVLARGRTYQVVWQERVTAPLAGDAS